MPKELPFAEEIRQHAAREYPREACGLVVGEGAQGRYLPCRNRADGTGRFDMHPEDILRAESEGGIAMVVHSHPGGAPIPSEADRVMMERWGVPWLIVGWPTGEIRIHRPDGYRPPLIGRVFSYGVLDCFSLIRDYYAETLGIEIPDFERAPDWWNKGGNLYLEHFEEAGFVDVSGQPMREHDVALIQLRSPVPNHGAVYLGDGVILHHLQSRLSRREAYAGYWQKHTCKIARHRTLC